LDDKSRVNMGLCGGVGSVGGKFVPGQIIFKNASKFDGLIN
jgi:hypothetical protein